MNKYRAIVIDDDPYTHERLKDLLQHYNPIIAIVASCNSATEGLAAISILKPDLVFLDIEMPIMNGFQMLELLPEIDFEIIFITSYDQYAIKAIRFSALDYLLKPIRKEELSLALDRYISKLSGISDIKARMGNFTHNLKTKNPRQFRLVIAGTDGSTFVETDEIIRLEANINYTNFFLVSNRKLTASKTLKEFDQLLSDHDFIRIHKSHLVNLKFVRQITNERQLLMADNSKVEVSTRRWEDVKNILKTM